MALYTSTPCIHTTTARIHSRKQKEKAKLTILKTPVFVSYGQDLSWSILFYFTVAIPSDRIPKWSPHVCQLSRCHLAVICDWWFQNSVEILPWQVPSILQFADKHSSALFLSTYAISLSSQSKPLDSFILRWWWDGVVSLLSWNRVKLQNKWEDVWSF